MKAKLSKALLGATGVVMGLALMGPGTAMADDKNDKKFTVCKKVKYFDKVHLTIQNPYTYRGTTYPGNTDVDLIFESGSVTFLADRIRSKLGLHPGSYAIKSVTFSAVCSVSKEIKNHRDYDKYDDREDYHKAD